MYFAELTMRLAKGIPLLSEEHRKETADFFWQRQNPDGGFYGRSAFSDLYYTSFSLRGLAILGELDGGEKTAQAGDYLQKAISDSLEIVDIYSVLFSAVLLEMAAGIDVFKNLGKDRLKWSILMLERYRREDGGVSASTDSPFSSTYHTFLSAACLQLLSGGELNPATQQRDLIMTRQKSDGGFVELPQLKHSGTNPTSAAVALMKMCSDEERGQAPPLTAAEFLQSMQIPESGFCANSRICVADLLSTFSAIVAMFDLEKESALQKDALLRYVQSLRSPDGGYFGGEWDKNADAEYTFYGLAAESLLAGLTPF